MDGIRSNVSLAQLQDTMRAQPLTSLRVNKEGNGVDKGFAARGFGGKIVYAIRLAFQAIGIGVTRLALHGKRRGWMSFGR